MNALLYIGAYITIFLVSVVIGLSSGGRGSGVILGLIAIASFTILHLLFVYKMWDAINDGETATTPLKAVAFHFIPIFNLLWAGLNFATFPQAYNNFVKRNIIDAPSLQSGIFNLYLIVTLLFFSALYGAPMIGALIGVVQFLIYLALIFKTCEAINYLDGGAELVASKGPLGL